MAWQAYWKPSIYKGAVLTVLPRPILKLPISTTWKFDKHEVPLKAGCITYGHAIASDQIAITGQIGHVDGTTKISEEEMFATLEALKTALNVANGSGKYEFFIYHNTGAAVYRKFKNVVTVAFDVDLGDSERAIWPYSIIMQPEDMTIYSTGPGL